MATLTPTGGTTYCPIYTGSFSYTYDGNTSTLCCFSPMGSCLSEWYWDTPVNVTKLNLYTLNFYLNSDIYQIWGRVNESWVELWSGTWVPSNGWSSKAISCNNCTGIRIGQHLGSQQAAACINEVTVDYELPPEGYATIVSIATPSTFTPGVQFRIRPTIRNDGAGDTLFVELTNTDTGAVFKPDPPEVYVSSGRNWVPSIWVTLTQTTDFHWLMEAGHVED